MLNVDEALKQILAYVSPINDIEQVDLDNLVERVLAEDQHSSVDVPPANNSAMDGYAINTADLSSNEQNLFTISQRVIAGGQAEPLQPKTAARIFTGAEIPVGANAVVMQEKCDVIDDKITIPWNTPQNDNIRLQGQDINNGSCILKKGRRLQSQDLGLLASIGKRTAPVYRQLSIAILSTGNELVEPGTALEPGQIYNSNRYLLKGLLTQLGFSIVDCGLVKDDLESTKDCLTKAANADCIISTGGVSVGEEDYIKRAVDELGELNLWRIALKPGKPLAFGHIQETPFFGLPGNPVSTFLTFLLFVRPFLRCLQGQTYKPLSALHFKANFNHRANPKREEYIRVTMNPQTGEVDAFSNQSSGVLSSVVETDAFACLPVNTEIKIGDDIQVFPFSHFLH